MFERTIHTNFLSMVYGIEAVLPLLRQSPAPQLVGMSSTVAYRGLPRSEAYGASKAAIKNLFESTANRSAAGRDQRLRGVPGVCPYATHRPE